MKNLITTTILFVIAMAGYSQGVNVHTHFQDEIFNVKFSKAAGLDSILRKFAPAILPGASIAVYSESEGMWASAAGYADVKNKVLMTMDHLQYIQSVSKMYIAVTILQLSEQGKINIEAAITSVLPKKYTLHIEDADKITIRNLLNHTSGIPEYNENPEFLSEVMLHPMKNFTSMECLKSISGKRLEFTPGSRYHYINTNYLLLALIADKITGDHTKYIAEHIFKPLNLKNSFYENGQNYLKELNLPESYWDVFNNGLAINVTPLQKMTVECSKGDDGIVCTTTDAVLFLKGLFEGKLLNPASMKEMMSFVKDEEGNNRYGMGMIYFDLGGLPAYGHGGGGIGAGCGLIYIPSHKIYAFFSTNIGVFSNGKTPDKAGEMRDQIMALLLE
jgi:D-alanyl-D-alanine carboxypeptidase